jgi:hypothetical protein
VRGIGRRLTFYSDSVLLFVERDAVNFDGVNDPMRICRRCSRPQVNPKLSLLIGYDDFANGRRAISFLRYLKEAFGDLCMFNPQFLRFEDLMRPQVAQEMGSDAAMADMAS